MEEAVQLQEARFERHGIDLRAVLPPDLPLLLCRQTQIGQILTNLVNNSYDAIVEQKCTERWVLLEVRANGEFLEFDVTDSGNGIDQEARKHLMEPFYTTKTRGLGMGVGLSLSRAIANEHGGTLELCTDTDHTRFRLSVPIEFQQESLVAAASEEVR
jgi:signal transduction histidine kinase